jgi:hypothetical protein
MIENSTLLSVSINDNDKKEMFKKTYSAEENTANSLEEVFRIFYIK